MTKKKAANSKMLIEKWGDGCMDISEDKLKKLLIKLLRRNPKGETELLLMEYQNNIIRNNSIKAKVVKARENSKYRL